MSGNPRHWRDVEEELLTLKRCPPHATAGSNSPGVYAWWDPAGVLDSFRPEGCPEVDWTRPVYVGKAERSIGARFQNMHLADTRQSSIRRSLAGLLYRELDLLPGITSVGAGKIVMDEDEEARLTSWMLANLTVTWVVLRPGPGTVEKEIICHLSPLLNDTHARNSPYRRYVRNARSVLCELAKSQGSSSSLAVAAEEPE